MVIFSALALLAFAACGGGDDDDDSGGGNTATATQDGGGGGGDATQDPSDGGDDGGDNSDPFANLGDLAEGLDQVTGRVTYEIDNDGDVSTMKLYSDPPNSRYDTTDSDGNSSIIIYTADNTYSCSSDPEACFALPSDDSGGLGGLGFLSGFFGAGAIGIYTAAAQAAGLDVDTSSEEYGGIDAECFSWADPSDDEGSVKFCFGDNGIMVYEEIKDSTSSTTITLIEYSEDVSDSDFDPPYPVTTIPGQ